MKPFGETSDTFLNVGHFLKLKKIGQHTCTPPNSIQFRKFTQSPRSQHILPFYHPISTVGLLILILDLLLFPPPLLHDLSSHLTYSLLFYLSYMEQVFFFCIVHCKFVSFSPLGDPLDQGLVPVGESIKYINPNLYTSDAAAIGFKIFRIRSITHQENTWTTRNKDSTQIYTGWTCTTRHLKTSSQCREAVCKSNVTARFQVIARARNASHLGFLEALFIGRHAPALCAQKEFVRAL